MTYNPFQIFCPIRSLAAARWLGFALILMLLAVPSFSQVEETYAGAPNLASPLTPYVQLPDIPLNNDSLDCSLWPEGSPPAEGWLANGFGHRFLGSNPDFHRGIDLRCNQHGRTCCQTGGTVTCDPNVSSCTAPATEVLAPIYALLDGDITRAETSGGNSIVIQSTVPGTITIGDTTCDQLFIWYTHMEQYGPSPDGDDWEEGDSPDAGDLLGWQGKYGANTVHLHLGTRACSDERATDPSQLDPEFNPFLLIGTDNGLAPEILEMTTEVDGDDLVVTVQVETDDPDFDQLEISIYDAATHQTHVRRLGYNSRDGIDVGGTIDTLLLEPRQESQLLAIDEPNPPDPTSGLTLEARFVDLALTFDYDSYVVAKAADVFGNTSWQREFLFGDAEIGDFVWVDANDNGLQDVTEGGLPGVQVELLHGFTGDVLATTVTDGHGQFLFDELRQGLYRLRMQPPGGYGATQLTPIFHDAIDSNLDPFTLETEDVSLTHGEINHTIDAGFTSSCRDVPLVTFNSVWRTHHSHVAGWEAENFDDSSWSTGLAPLGFSNGAVFTDIQNAGHTNYFRTEFFVDDRTFWSGLELALLRDDGAVVYLNGVEVMRTNLPAGPIQSETPASVHSFDLVEVPLSLLDLEDGRNVLAVEVHNRDDYDLVFDLELSALACRTCVGELTLPARADTWIDSNDPADNEGDDTRLRVDGSPQRSSLITWDWSAVPAGATALAADLTFRVIDDGHAFPLYTMKTNWLENAATWNHATTGVTWDLPGANGLADADTDPVGLADFDVTEGEDMTFPINATGLWTINSWLDGS
ncbi:MAG: SdrD B-like domain-containing protein, partial [Acidobacteriota bacterium]